LEKETIRVNARIEIDSPNRASPEGAKAKTVNVRDQIKPSKTALKLRDRFLSLSIQIMRIVARVKCQPGALKKGPLIFQISK
jgi:hypothetical protein